MLFRGKFRACWRQLNVNTVTIVPTKNQTLVARSLSTSPSTKMRFVQFVKNDGSPEQLGIQINQGGEIVPLSFIDPNIPNSLYKFLEGGEELLTRAKIIISEHNSKKYPVIYEKDVKMLPPISNMDKLLCIGLNYSGYCKDHNLQPPTNPIVFNKFPSNIIGPYDDIHLPTTSNEVDWEGELAIVIGKKAKNVTRNEAEDCIFGYTVAQDLSARDWFRDDRNGGQFLLGKAVDDFCPLGPSVVTKDSITDVNNIVIRSYVNGKLKQNGNTSELIFKPKDIISYLSQFMTLLPGDLILTGTPSGVGFSRNPPEFLQPGDVLVTEIEPIGRLRNNVV